MTTTTNPITVPTLKLAAGRWEIDPGHAEVAFVGRHFGLTKIRGRFVGVRGTVDVADPIDRSTLEVVIDVASVESGSADRDEHLRSSDLFDVATHPTATFRSTGIIGALPHGLLHGELTLKGVTRPVALDVHFAGSAVDPWGGERAVFSASTVINRYDWGVDWNMPLKAGGLLVSKEIRIEIEVELVRR